MSCSPAFPETIPFACAVEIFEDVRGGEISADLITKGLWLAGSITGKFGGTDDVTLANVAPVGMDELEAHFGSDVSTSATIPPAVWLMLAKLIIDAISKRMG